MGGTGCRIPCGSTAPTYRGFLMPECGGSWSVTIMPFGGIQGSMEMLPSAFLTSADPGFGIVFPELGMGQQWLGHLLAWPTWKACALLGCSRG